MSVLDPFRAARLVLELRQAGVTDRGVMAAIEKTPRAVFVPSDYRDMAYDNTQVPIACGQELSLPVVVGRMLQALKLDDRCRVLEIGTGVGYQAAVMSLMARRVFSVERFRTLTETAKSTLDALGIRNVEVRLSDGRDGWPESAPFDRIIITCAVAEVPPALTMQLAEDGFLIAPIEENGAQQVILYKKVQNSLEKVTTLGASKFLPIISGTAREL